MSGISSQGVDSGTSPWKRPTVSEESIICKPLKNLREVAEFLNDPPVWRSLCIELKPHSEDVIRNIDIVEKSAASDSEINLERPETFCHFDEAKEDVRRHRRKDLPKTLVCHDMANGYHDDCNIDGTGNHEAYTFYNWAAVDIFCYFSHHFVTVPPLGWINVGHAHGVKVIGTVITEWGAGGAAWESLLAAPAAWRGLAADLVAVAKTLRFDGWLLNIENKISKPDVLLEFVRYLHSLLHSEVPGSVLIWYDSVTVSGDLVWQNTLNEHNKAFFDACDGIFTNYSWSSRHVAAARAAAGARARDVFVGLDVWGRNFLGGGQFNTQEAVKIAHQYGLSLAIFAPAWTHEALGQADPWFQTYLLRERALWGSLWPFLHTKLPNTLPFATSFCTGQGNKRRLYGEVLAPTPWYNLRHQHYQPNASLGPHGFLLKLSQNPCQPSQPNVPQLQAIEIKAEEKAQIDEKENTIDNDEKTTETQSEGTKPNSTDCVVPNSNKPIPRYQLIPTDEEACQEKHFEDSFTGGSCLLINPEYSRLVRLFHCDFNIQGSLIVCVVTKTLPALEDQFLNVVLCVNNSGRETRVVLLGSAVAGVGEVSAVSGQAFVELKRYLLLQQPGFYVSVENAYGWKVRYYRVPLAGHRVTSINCAASGPILLGHLGLCHRMENVD